MYLRIRPEIPDDAPLIEAVTIAAFLDAPHTSHTEQFVIRSLRAAGALTVSLVAEADGRLVGHVAVSPVTMSTGARDWYGLGPVAVDPPMQGRGIGSRLMRAALQQLRDANAAGCVLLGEPAYYGRFGFKAEPGLKLPGVPAEYFQAVAFRGAVPRGSVAFHAAYAATE
jgi:putative acetyltransferase